MRLPFAPFLALLVLLTFGHPPTDAAEPLYKNAAELFFKKGDVIALVGGEDMVVASEYGYLELLLASALPDYRLRFRDLACEGDTVFEQRRELNFPTWEEQLDKIGATVVIAQFGQMESLAGKEKLPEFIAAYEKLIERFSGGGKRRVVLLSPSPFEEGRFDSQEEQLALYRSEIANLSGRLKIQWIDATRILRGDRANIELHKNAVNAGPAPADERLRRTVEAAKARALADLDVIAVTHRDGVHLSKIKQHGLARAVLFTLVPPQFIPQDVNRLAHAWNEKPSPLLIDIVAKNRLWFDYWRPQNWAFLAGDRTSQPSSRDHLDPSKRWFPPEREQFLPLIEAKEKEIDTLAAKLAKP